MDNAALYFNKLNMLVTGGAGFIGGNLVRMLLTECPDISITIVDNLLSSERVNIPADKRIRFIEGSIADDGILAAIPDQYEYIFHLATYHGNQSSIANPLADHENNMLTTLKLYDHVKNFSTLKKLVYSASGCSIAKKTYDEVKETTEDDPIDIEQDSPYSISKIIGEFYSVYYNNQQNLPVVRARFQNVYGPGEILGAGRWRGTPATVWRNVIPTFIYKALQNMPLPIENEGRATRDFIYVEDICRGLMACAIIGKAGDVYNLASGKEVSILQLASLINEVADNKHGVEYVPSRPWDHSGRRYGSTIKAERELRFKAQVDLEKGLINTVDWTVNNIHLIEATIAKHKCNMDLPV
jgi:UDP-glucose 4-epimerase